MSPSNFRFPSQLVLTSPVGCAPYLLEELSGLGLGPGEFAGGTIRLPGTLEDCIRLNLQLRSASQVLYSLGQFSCDGPEALYRQVQSIAWEKWLPSRGYFSVTSHVMHPSIRSSMYANLRVKDAIVDRLRAKTGHRPDSGAELRGAVVYLYWRDDRAELFLDTSGPTLSKHGYRHRPGKAPMNESLAAAIVKATNWTLGTPFLNPMCGSGTIAIEAALLATHRFPGLFREHYAFEHLIGFDRDFFRGLRDELRLGIRPVPPGCRLIASDHDPGAVEIARANAAEAGVGEQIEFQVGDFEQTEVPPQPGGVVVLNPEYGERLGEIEALKLTYSRIGDFLKQRCGGYRGFVFTANLELAKSIGLRSKRRLEFSTANLPARLLEYELYAGSRKSPKAETR